MHSTSHVSPKLTKKKKKKKEKKVKTPFSPGWSWSYKNLHDSLQKEGFALRLYWLMGDMQQVDNGAGAGGDMECSLIPLGGVMGMGLFFSPSFPNWASFYVVGFWIHIMLEEE